MIVICGKETLDLVERTEPENEDGYQSGSKYTVTVKQAEGEQTTLIPIDTVKSWFELDTSEDSDPECLVKDDAYELEGATFARYSTLQGIIIRNL